MPQNWLFSKKLPEATRAFATVCDMESVGTTRREGAFEMIKVKLLAHSPSC
jgi:hypothetical protein